MTTQVSPSSVLRGVGVLRTGRELVLAPYLVGEHLVRVGVGVGVRVRVRVRIRVGEHPPLRSQRQESK